MAPRKSEILVGAHTSAAGGAPNALYRGQDIGATSIQLFTSNQKQWKPRQISEEEVEEWFAAKDETGIHVTMCHNSYLTNLGAPNPEVYEKSLMAFEAEIERCQLLEIDYLNFHPGSATTSSREECLDKIVKSLLTFTKLLKNSPTRLLLEATAGQGSTVGCTFEELGYIVERTHKKIPIGVCIDTCHIFAAGYDIRTKAKWEKVLKEFDEKVGLEHLYAFHLNDSKHPLGSRKDRHEQLGKGEIGMECFEVVMSHPKLKNMLKILETPEPEDWPREISLLKKFATKRSKV